MNVLRLLFAGLLALSFAGCATLSHPAETEALAVLASDADLHAKAGACRQLETDGGPSSVPALAALLGHEQLADYARSALEAIPSERAGAALREALSGLDGRRLAGVVNSLGVRRERTAVPQLQALVRDPARGVAAEALAALGLIGTPDTAAFLVEVLVSGPVEVRVPAAHAALVAAQQLAGDGNAAAARITLASLEEAPPSRFLAEVAAAQAAMFAR